MCSRGVECWLSRCSRRSSVKWLERFIVGLLALLAAFQAVNVAAPFLVRWCSRSYESECMSNLRVWFAAETSWYADRKEYSTDFAAIGFAPESYNRYLYTDDPLGTFASRMESAPHTVIPPSYQPASSLRFADIPARVAGGEVVGISGACPNCRASAVCVAQLDDDDEVDVWSISTVDRIDEVTDAIVVAGIPFHERTDRHPQRSMPARWLRL